MNYYQFHIGDYISATRHLSWDEDMAYRRLLDAYYMREGPLPADIDQVCRLVAATTEVQRSAVAAVLNEFFVRADDGWCNTRADDEISVMVAKRRNAKASARSRWKKSGVSVGKHSKKPIMRTHSDGNAMAMHSQCDGNAPNTNTNTNTNSRNIIDDVKRARELETRLREAAGWQNEPAPMLAVTGPIEALIAAGADLETDVLPVLSALGPRCKRPVSWNYFIGAIAAARDRRIEAATIVSPPSHPGQWKNHEQNQRKPSRDDAFSAIDRRIEEICEAERREAGSGSPSAGDCAERPTRN